MNAEFAKAADRLERAKLKAFSDGRLAEFLPKEPEQRAKIEALTKNKEKALEVIFPKVALLGNQGARAHAENLLVHQQRSAAEL